MKKLIILAGALTLALNVHAQKMPEPEFRNRVMFVEANNSLSDLDKTDLQTSLKTNMAGRSTVNLIAKGKSAAVTHTGTSKETFMVKLEPGIDPDMVVELFKFETEKKMRKILVATMVMGKDKDVDMDKAPLKFTKVSDGVYTISVKEQLEPGEYCFMVNRPQISILGAASSQTLHGECFTVN